jgi:hypothetical protein
VVPTKSKYADSKSSAYLRGTWLKTKKYQTVILVYLRYVSIRELSHPVYIHTVSILFQNSFIQSVQKTQRHAEIEL